MKQHIISKQNRFRRPRNQLRQDTKSFSLSGHKKGRLGTPLGIHDKDGNMLYVGDEITYGNELCVILWNESSKRWEAMLERSLWYQEKNKFDETSYGKSLYIPMDDGARMSITLLSHGWKKTED